MGMTNHRTLSVEFAVLQNSKITYAKIQYPHKRKYHSRYIYLVLFGTISISQQFAIFQYLKKKIPLRHLCIKTESVIVGYILPCSNKKSDKSKLVGFWCERRDLNPYESPHTPLKRARLPIPPLSHIQVFNFKSYARVTLAVPKIHYGFGCL